MALQDYRDIIHRCFRCGYCKFPTNHIEANNCPAYARFRLESYSAGGRLWLIRAWMNNEIECSERLARIVFACTACRNCVERCPYRFSDEIVDMIVAAKNEMVDRGLVRSTIRNFLENVKKYGNPYGEPRETRGKWADGIGIPRYNGQEFLYYVGCVGSYDTRAVKAAKALGQLLLEAGVSFGVLGADEDCDGNEVGKLGEETLFEMLAQKNIEQFKRLVVRKIVALSPHSYNAMKNEYPNLEGHFEVVHATHLLRDLIKSGKLKLSAKVNAIVTYHDPCFLGRWNEQYDAPRDVLRALPGVKLVEMERNKSGALCCGGGGGNFGTDFLGGSEDSPARIRIREACATGADILATACPICLTMFEDALKTEGLEGRLVVKDVSEIVAESSLGWKAFKAH
jgi:Fe-S oxidoreductase